MFTDGFLASLPSRVIPHLKRILSFDTTFDEETGEVKRSTARYKTLTISVVRDKYVLIYGSLPKFYQGNNYEDFSFRDCVSALDLLCGILGLKKNEIRVHRLEFGINFHIEDEPQFLGALLTYKNRPFETFSIGSLEIQGKRCILSQYQVKVYNKGVQEFGDAAMNFFRFELRVKRMQFISSNPVTFETLSDRKFHLHLRDALLRAWENIEVAEDQLLSRVNNAADKGILENWFNPRYLEWLRSLPVKEFNKLRKRYRRRIAKYDSEQLLRRKIYSEIFTKSAQLLSENRAVRSYTLDDYLRLDRLSIISKPNNNHNEK